MIMRKFFIFFFILFFFNQTLADTQWITKKKKVTNIESDNSIGTKLKDLTKLYKDGVLNKDQFEKAKKRLLNNENINISKSEEPQSFDWAAISKHPKSNNEFVATRLSTKKKAIDLAMKKCYQYVTSSLGKSGYNDCSLVKVYNEKEKIKTQINKADSSQNQELTNVIDKIERLTPGDYYLFAHSTAGDKFWGSTKAINKATQTGKAISSSGYSCKIKSKQITSRAPYKGSFVITCPNEKINGSWTQETGYSPGIGQAFTDNGDVITAFFSYKQSVIIDFAKKYYETKKTQIAEKEPIEEFQPKQSTQDNEPPVIDIAKTITVNNASYEIEGKVSDKSNKIFIQVDGRNISVKNGKFKVKRFSPVDEQISIIATDQWGNSSEPKLVNVIIDIEDTIVADKIESLDPSKINSKTNKQRVALIIGIEKYDQTPEATFANLDAKYFYEYVRKGFGVQKSNIKLLINEKANLIQSLGTLKKWLPSKVKKNQTELIIFFAGHGLASSDGKELFLLPQDGDPDLLARTAISRTELFKEIISLKPKNVTIFLDTCYSGVSRDERTLLASARPVRIVANDQEEIPNNFTIFSASKLDQISSGLKEAKHGIFSYYLMKGLEGKADTNKDKKITNGELLAYMDENVSQRASELGRQQNPSLAGDPDKVLMTYR